MIRRLKRRTPVEELECCEVGERGLFAVKPWQTCLTSEDSGCSVLCTGSEGCRELKSPA